MNDLFYIEINIPIINKTLLGSGGIDHPESLRINHF